VFIHPYGQPTHNERWSQPKLTGNHVYLKKKVSLQQSPTQCPPRHSAGLFIDPGSTGPVFFLLFFLLIAHVSNPQFSLDRRSIK
jgi:hypothetical protein